MAEDETVDIPDSMRPELAAWNDGADIDVVSWIGCEGRFALAVGYGAIFWPEFVAFDGYILRKGFSEARLREFERQENSTRMTVEWLMNHRHITDMQYYGCPDASRDKIILLGNLLQEIYTAKLLWKFPETPCIVEFHQPDDADSLIEYQISFWQRRHGERGT